MKKLFFILLYLQITFILTSKAQVGPQHLHLGTYYLPPAESVSDGGAFYDACIEHVVDFNYHGHNHPDSIYGDHGILIFGSLTYDSPGKIATVDIDIAPFLFIDMIFTYNQNNKVESFNYVSTGVEINNTNEQFFYNSSQQLSEKISIDLYSGINQHKFFEYSGGKLVKMKYYLLPSTTLFQEDTLIYNQNNQLERIETSFGATFRYFYNSQHLCETVLLDYSSVFLDTVCYIEYDIDENLTYYMSKSYDFSGLSPFMDGISIWSYNFDQFNRNIHEVEHDENTGQPTSNYADYIYFNIPTATQEHTTNKDLIGITDILGRETKGTNQPLLYIYDDGTVEKRIIIE